MCWHKWSKWEIVIIKVVNSAVRDKLGELVDLNKTRQQRRCKKCGLTEESSLEPGW